MLGRLDFSYGRTSLAQSNLLRVLDAQPDDSGLQANCIQALGDVHVQLSEYQEARARYEEAQPIYRAIGDRLGEANCYLGLADIDRREESWAAAAAGYKRALAFYRSARMAFNTALALPRLGYTARSAGDVDQARRYIEEALAIFQRIGSPSAASAQKDMDTLAPGRGKDKGRPR